MEKTCIQCGSTFAKVQLESRSTWDKRRFCGKPCWYAWKSAQPSKSKMIPCRVCGEPTRYRAAVKDHVGLVHCGLPQCREESRRRKNEAIRSAHLAGFASGKRTIDREAWKKVPRVSRQETAIAPWMKANGWTPEYIFLTQQTAFPRWYRLDFAIPDRSLCVEIDGSVHRLRKDHDAKRDQILAAKGWRILRVPASVVDKDLPSATQLIEDWLSR